MKKYFVLILALATLLCCGHIWAQPADVNKAVVTVTGSGMSKEEAIRDGQRKAVEQVFSKVYSRSETKDFVLAKDTVLVRAAGLVEKFDIISTQVALDGVITLKMRVYVSNGKIDDLWAEVTNLLKQMGRPRIMVYIDEKVDGVTQPLSTLQTGIEQRLLANGFILVDKNQLKAIDKKDLEAAVAENRPDRIQAIAKRFGAQIFVTGTAGATRAGKRVLYGRTMNIYQADSRVRVYRSDTAQLLASVTGLKPAQSKGVQQSTQAAATQSLEKQGKFVGQKVTMDILRFWMDVLAGRGEVKLYVANLENYRHYSQLKKKLSAIKGVSAVNGKFRNKNADISIETSLSAEMLADKISESMGSLVDITDVSQNVIKGEMPKDDE